MQTRKLVSLTLALLGIAAFPACAAEKPGATPALATTDAKHPVALKLDPSPLAAGPNARATSYADVIEPVQAAVVSVYSSKTTKQRVQVPDIFRQFYGNDAFPDRESTERGLGSGVIVSKDGYILTHNHVVAEADSLRVTLNDGREFDAKVIGTDPKTDVAVIKVDATNLPILTLADSDKLRVGDIVFAVGNPLGVGQTVTMGIISATGRQVGILAEQGGYESFIQTDAAINQGNSGGALVDAQGRLVGINSAILSGRGSTGNIGIGFAIPVNLASSVLASLVDTGSVSRGYLGITGETLTPDLAEALAMPRDQKGVIVTNLPKDSPAAKAGLARSDVITAIDGKAVNTMQDLRFIIAAKAPGSAVEVKLLRDDKERTIRVNLGSLDTAVADRETLRGVKLEPLSDENRQRVGAPRDLSGLVITDVADDSPFARRLAAGMVIVAINRQAVDSLDDAQRLLRPGTNLVVIFARGQFSHVAITVGK
jgi:serine protease Do/serine protease DegQ